MITPERKKQLIAEHATGTNDSGSPEVQIAILSERISNLTEHLKTTALRHHLDHAAARVIVLGVGLEMFGEVGDALRQDRDLHFRRTGVVLARGVLGHDFLFAFRRNHRFLFRTSGC